MDQLSSGVFPSIQPAGRSEASISTAAQQCRALLRACRELDALKHDEWAENRLAEFNLWTASSGVFAGDRASLDYRLAPHPEVKSVMVSLLAVLTESLTQCQYYGMEQPAAVEEAELVSDAHSDDEEASSSSGSILYEKDDGARKVIQSDNEASESTPPEDIPRAFSPWSDDSSMVSDEDTSDTESLSPAESMLVVPKAEVSRVIDHLARLSLAIRKAGSNSRSHKADLRFHPEDHPALRRHLNLVVLARGSEDGRSDYDIDLNSLTTVQERLVVANLRRRNRYIYAQRHAVKLAAEATTQPLQNILSLDGDWPVLVEEQGPGKPEGEEPAQREDLPTEVQEPITEQPAAVELALPVETHLPILSATSASAVTQTIDPGLIHNVTPSQVAKTEITTTTAKITYPKPPPIPPGLSYFKCPCCCQTLPAMYRQNSLWK